MPEVIVRILALAHGGSFIGEVAGDSALKGKKAFVRGAAVGELVRAEIIEDKRSFIEARLLEIIEPSADRTTPPCPYFECCGGCDLQHITINAQRRAKLQMVRDTILRQGGLTPTKGVTLAGEALPGFGYRRRITVHLNPAGEIGFYRPNSGTVVPIEHCPIASKSVNDAFRTLRGCARALAEFTGSIVIEEHAGAVFLLLKLREGVRWSTVRSAASKTLSGIFSDVNVLEGRREFGFLAHAQEQGEGAIPIGHFSQVNSEGNTVLTELVCSAATGPGITELYAGGGNLSFPLAARGAAVDAVEVDPALVRYGSARAAELGVQSRVRFILASAEKYVRSCQLKETVVLDPPRAGAKEVVRAFTPARVGRVVYVSCSLPTLVRDLKALASQGFKLEEVAVVDMFPQTHHVECVAVMSGAQEG